MDTTNEISLQPESTLAHIDEIREARVPADPVREHLAELMTIADLDRIAAAARMTRSTIVYVYYGPHGASNRMAGTPPQTVRASIARRILSLAPERVGPAVVDATGTVRRLQALVAIGYPQTFLSERLGMNLGTFSGVIHGKRARVSPKMYTAACDLFAELWIHPVQGHRGERSRKLAKSYGWVGPLAWDDIDDPMEVANVRGPKKKRVKVPANPDDSKDVAKARSVKEPLIDEIAIELAMKGEPVKLTTAERCVAVTRLHRERWSDNRIAATLRTTDRTVLRIRRRLGLEAFDFSEIRQVESA